MQEKFRCPYASRCGGCELTDLCYSDQLAYKQAMVAKLLKPFGRVEPIRGMAQPLHYRNKVHAVVANDRRGMLTTGVYQAGSHRVIPVEHCLIEDERADAIIATVRKLAVSFKLRAYDEDRRTGFLRHILVRAGRREVMLVLVTATAEFPSKSRFVAALREAHPELTTIVQNVNDRRTNMVLGTRDISLYGSGRIEDELCGKVFRLSPQSFYQVNSAQTEVLYGLAKEMAQLSGRETVVDAYCGVGTIGLSMIEQCGRLIGVELNPQAVKDAAQNAKRNGVSNAAFYQGDAGMFLTQCASEGAAVDVVLMDPPRSGSDGAFLSALLRLKPKRIVYISCDPTTLARDLKTLCAGGYAMERAVPVDMFPLTSHVENVILLSKGNVDVKHIKVDISLEDMDLSELQTHATYTQIKARVKEQTGLDVSNLYIAQVKAKCGIKERANYNHAKSADAKQPVCPAEKEKAIREALKYFGMI